MPVDLVMDEREGETLSKSEVESARNSVEQVQFWNFISSPTTQNF